MPAAKPRAGKPPMGRNKSWRVALKVVTSKSAASGFDRRTLRFLEPSARVGYRQHRARYSREQTQRWTAGLVLHSAAWLAYEAVRYDGTGGSTAATESAWWYARLGLAVLAMLLHAYTWRAPGPCCARGSSGNGGKYTPGTAGAEGAGGGGTRGAHAASPVRPLRKENTALVVRPKGVTGGSGDVTPTQAFSASTPNLLAGAHDGSPFHRLGGESPAMGGAAAGGVVLPPALQDYFETSGAGVAAAALAAAFAFVWGVSRAALASDGAMDQHLVWYHADAVVSMAALGFVKVAPLGHLSGVVVLAVVWCTWLGVVLLAAGSPSAEAVDDADMVAAGAQVTVLCLMFGALNYVSDRNRRERFLLVSENAGVTDRIMSLQQSLTTAAAATGRDDDGGGSGGSGGEGEGGGGGGEGDRIEQLQLKSAHVGISTSAATLRMLAEVDEIVRSGELRTLYYQANSADVRVRLNSTNKLRQFLQLSHAVIVRSQGLGIHDPRVKRVLTATNAMSVAQQWLDKVRLAEEGETHGSVEFHVFLGGSCNPTTWRRDTAIPALEAHGITYYNPQVDEWSEELIEIETRAKASASVLLFVIDGVTRGVVSMGEVTELICRGRTTVLVVQDLTDGTRIGDGVVTGRELKDLNRGRAYLRELAQRSGVNVYASIEEAVDKCVELLKDKAMRRSSYVRLKGQLSDSEHQLLDEALAGNAPATPMAATGAAGELAGAKVPARPVPGAAAGEAKRAPGGPAVASAWS